MNNHTGHTLIELVVVILILSILTMLTLPLAENMVLSKKEKELEYRLWLIRDAIDRYRDNKRKLLNKIENPELYYPKSLKDLVDDTNGSNANSNYKLKLLREIPRDPFSNNDIPAELSWEIIYYNPENPQSSTVFDVKSKSKNQSLRGSFYYEW